MSRPLPQGCCFLSSPSRAQNCVPIAPEATDSTVVGPKYHEVGHGIRPGPLEDPGISAIAARVGKTPAQVLLAWAVQRGTALLTTPRTAARAAGESQHLRPSGGRA
jgi:diketogulonate reductase-like aldo/keto reductase